MQKNRNTIQLSIETSALPVVISGLKRHLPNIFSRGDTEVARDVLDRLQQAPQDKPARVRLSKPALELIRMGLVVEEEFYYGARQEVPSTLAPLKIRIAQHLAAFNESLIPTQNRVAVAKAA